MLNKKLNSLVVSNDEIARNIYTLVLEVAPETQKLFRPGQFAHIKIPDADALLLRRPISINKMDFEHGHMLLTYRIMGEGTRRLAEVKAGSRIDVLAPLGNGFHVTEQAKNIWLVGGGIGIAPLLSPGNVYPDRRYTAFLGYKNQDDAYQIEDFKAFCADVLIASDDGSIGRKCLVTDLVKERLETESPDLILACGPGPMFRSLKAIKTDAEIQASLEQHMGCGTGGCATCVCKIGEDYKKVCLEGPVFPLREVSL